jgi:hypothetical protein
MGDGSDPSWRSPTLRFASEFAFVEHAAGREYARLVPKPTVIDTPFPTLDDVARTYGISATRRKRLERQVQEFLTRDAAANHRSSGASTRKTAARKSRKK